MGPRFCGVEAATFRCLLEERPVDLDMVDDGELPIDRFAPAIRLVPEYDFEVVVFSVAQSAADATAKKDLTDLVWGIGLMASAVRNFMDAI